MIPKKPFLHCILLLFSCLSIHGQVFTLQKKHHDFGEIANLDFPPAVFEFKNTGKKPLAILMIQKNHNVQVHFERKYYQPGESGIIQVSYNSNRIGKFSEELSVLTNASENHETISISGENISVLDCFPDKDNFNIRLVNVIDKITKKPVPDAEVHLIHNKRTPVSFNVNDEGKKEKELKIGLYDVSILAPGYEKLENSLFLEKSVPYVFFEMEPQNEPKKENIQAGKSLSETRISESELSREKYAENNIVLLVDVSLSMKNSNKLNLLKTSIQKLVDVLRDIDRVTLISYSSYPKVHLSSIPGNETKRINQVIDSLYPQGITNGVKGLEKAYELAEINLMTAGNNQVILATDGKFNSSNLTNDVYTRMIHHHANNGIAMSIIGFGSDHEAVDNLKEMASVGKGNFYHVSAKKDIADIMVNEIKSNSLKKKH